MELIVMTQNTLPFDRLTRLDYRNFVILRFHGYSKRKICKMYNLAYFRILEVCEMIKKMTIDLHIRIINFKIL